jgi:hypothetical protein
MDLSSLISNKPLLAELSRQYEALKSSAAAGGKEAVDYDAWIRERLRQTAAKTIARSLPSRIGSAAAAAAAPAPAPQGQQQHALAAVQRQQQAACAQQRLAYRTQMRQRQRVESAAAVMAGEDAAASGWQVCI